MTMPPHPPHLGAGIYLRKVDEYVLIVIPSHFRREAGVGVTVASSLLFWGGEVYFTIVLVKLGEDEPFHLPLAEKGGRMPSTLLFLEGDLFWSR